MREQGPGSGPWRKGEPEAHGLSSETLNRAADALAVAGERQGLVVIRNGVLVMPRQRAIGLRTGAGSCACAAEAVMRCWR